MEQQVRVFSLFPSYFLSIKLKVFFKEDLCNTLNKDFFKKNLTLAGVARLGFSLGANSQAVKKIHKLYIKDTTLTPGCFKGQLYMQGLTVDISV